MLAEYVQNQGRPVDDFGTEGVLQVALLGGRELVVKDDHVCFEFFHLLADLIDLARADVSGTQPVRPLGYIAHYLSTGRVRQVFEFGEGVFQRPRVVAAIHLDRDEHRLFRFGLYRN